MKTSLFPRNGARRRGMTLVELLVVISIMVMLVAISIPVFKPMLESQRSAGAARVVAGALQRTRVKAMQDMKTYGLEFVRFTEGNAPSVSIQLRLLRQKAPFINPESLRVVVVDGDIQVCTWSGSEWTTSGADTTLWENNVEDGHRIQFGRQGRSYELSSTYKLAAPYENLTLPDVTVSGTTYPWALDVAVTRAPVPAIAAQIVLPKGSVVDLMFSGTQEQNGTSYTQDIFTGNERVAVLFSPGGFVDGVMNGSRKVPEPTNEIVYFCIGEWERQSTDNAGNTYAEDGRNNLLMTSNYWVTVNPRSGQVRITEFAAAPESKITTWKNSKSQSNLQDMIPDVRKFATENALNLGGF